MVVFKVFEITSAIALVIVRLGKLIVHEPLSLKPSWLFALTDTVLAKLKVSAFVSTTPPFPEDAPPSATISPANEVEAAVVLIDPPLPESIADTLIFDLASVVNDRDAVIATDPPPTEPCASVSELAAIFTLSPSIIIRPPTLTNLLVTLLASNEPLCLITPDTKVFTALADKIIVPPFTVTADLFSMSVLMVAGVVVIEAK